jgi:hypothetical protein
MFLSLEYARMRVKGGGNGAFYQEYKFFANLIENVIMWNTISK